MLPLILALAVVEPPPPPPLAETVNTRADAHDRMTVPVTIDGRGPFPFVVDTGANRTVVTRELADALRLAPGPRVIMHTMTGVGEAFTVLVPRLGVGEGVRTDVLEAPALAENDVGAKGLLGIDSLKDRRVVMDFRRRTLTIANARTTRERVDVGTIVVTARSRYGQLILVDADVDGLPVTVILDTGSQNSIGNLALKAVLQRRRRNVTFRPTTLIDITGGVLPVDIALLDRIRIGGVSMTNVAVAFADAHPFKRFGVNDRPAMLLGMDTLRAFARVSVDFAARKVRFLLPGDPVATSGAPWFAFRSPGTTSPL